MPTLMDSIHSAVISALDLTAIGANIVLVYAIATRTPPSMRSYSILLLNNALVDVCSATASILATTRLLFVGGSQLYVYVGACSHVGIWFCHLCQSVHTFFVCHSTVILLHSFCFRLYILRDKLVKVSIPTMRTTVLICFVLYCPTLFFMSLFYASFEYTPPELMRELHFDQYPTTWNSHYTEPKFVIAMIFVVFLSPSAMVALFFVRRRLLVEISKSKSDSKVHHANIARALTYQMLLPAGLALACAAWLSSLAEIWKDEMAERLVMTLSSLFALFSPLINLTFLTPYRRMFGRKKIANTIGINDCDDHANVFESLNVVHYNTRDATKERERLTIDKIEYIKCLQYRMLFLNREPSLATETNRELSVVDA